MKNHKLLISFLLSLIMIITLSSCYTVYPKRKGIDSTSFSDSEREIMQNNFNAEIPFLEKHDYDLVNNFAKNLSVYYHIYEISNDEFRDYLNLYSEYNFITKRSDDDYLIGGEYYTYYDNFSDTYYDIVFSKNNGTDVYMYKKGDYNRIYDSYSNIDHPVNKLADTINFNNLKYSSVKDISSTNYVCPSKGNVKILVVPVQFYNSPMTTGINYIEEALNIHLKNYYYESSYGKLNLSFEIIPEWFMAEHSYSYYGRMINTNILIEEILSKYDDIYDYNDFDSDSDGYIDGIIIVNSNPETYTDDLGWSSTRYYISNKIDDISSFAYCHVNFSKIYTKKTSLTPFTLIHEFGHLLGLDDYYDTNYTRRTILSPIGIDVMDSTLVDHNPYSKSILGWINKAQFVKESTDIAINNFERTGDYAIISNNFDAKLGPFQEYYIIAYYNGTKNNNIAPFNKKCIVMYHVDSSIGLLSNESFIQYSNAICGYGSTKHFLLENINYSDSPIIIDLTKEKTKELYLIDNNGLPLHIIINAFTHNDNTAYLKISL